MKKLLLMIAVIFALCSSMFAGTCGTGYSFYRTVTIDHTKVPTADQSNYPMGFITTQTYLKVAGSGGKVQTSSGFDIIFCDAVPPTGNQLSHEIEQYVSTTGEVEYWVKVASISHTADTVIYLVYGKPGATDTQSVNAVWSNGYREVYHLSAITGTPGLHDSTSTGNTLTNHSGTNTTGQIDGAVGLNSASSAYLSGASDSFTSQVTAEAWVYSTSVSGFPMVISNFDFSGSGTGGWNLRTGNASGDGAPFFATNISGGGSSQCWYTTTIPMSLNTPHQLVGTANGGTNTLFGYLDGSLFPTGGQAGTTCPVNSSSFPVTVGAACLTSGCASPVDFWNGGWLDEVRVSGVVRDANWVAMEYNNLNSPSTFFTLGPENSVPIANVLRHTGNTVF